MNFVDKFDQMKTTYEIDRKSHKWWHKIFFYFLDAATVNAFIIAKELMSYEKGSCLMSRRRCALCSTKAKQVRTDWECSVCEVPLCLGKQKSWFQDYHKKVDYACMTVGPMA